MFVDGESLLVLAAGAVVAYHGYSRFIKKERPEINNVLFFPDRQIGMSDEGKMGDKIFKSYSTHSAAMARMLSFLRSAEKSLDLCLMLFTCHEFASELLSCQRRGVKVRLLLDYSNIGRPGCQLPTMCGAGVSVRGVKQPFLMHHKFVVIDSSLLMNGSFNWTGTAVMGNNENVVITNNTKVVQSYVGEFNKLWEKHAPDY